MNDVVELSPAQLMVTARDLVGALARGAVTVVAPLDSCEHGDHD